MKKSKFRHVLANLVFIAFVPFIAADSLINGRNPKNDISVLLYLASLGQGGNGDIKPVS